MIKSVQIREDSHQFRNVDSNLAMNELFPLGSSHFVFNWVQTLGIVFGMWWRVSEAGYALWNGAPPFDARIVLTVSIEIWTGKGRAEPHYIQYICKNITWVNKFQSFSTFLRIIEFWEVFHFVVIFVRHLTDGKACVFWRFLVRNGLRHFFVLNISDFLAICDETRC
jgi:hypothetical protein